MIVFEYRCKLKFLIDISYSQMAEKIAYFLDSALAADKDYLQFHKSRGYKFYVMDAPWPIETDGIYKEGKLYTVRIRTIKQDLAEYFSGKLAFHRSKELQGAGGELRIIPKKRLEKIYNVTPLVIKNEFGYWRGNMSVSDYEARVKTNLIKKYNEFTKQKIDENFMLYDVIEFRNQKPIKVPYKGVCLLGDKISMQVSANPMAQELAYFALGVGLGENNYFSCGFLNYRYM